MLTLVACIVKNKVFPGLEWNRIIGKNGDLMVKIKRDLQMFKLVTSQYIDNRLNITVTGSKTYFSIPDYYRPLRHRINFVLTNNVRLLKISKADVMQRNFDDTKPYFMDYPTFVCIYNEDPARNFFIIGGATVYNTFLEYWKLDKLRITEVNASIPITNTDKLTYIDNYEKNYEICKASNWFKEKKSDISYRFLEYYPK